jgi:hypothetical protein
MSNLKLLEKLGIVVRTKDTNANDSYQVKEST